MASLRPYLRPTLSDKRWLKSLQGRRQVVSLLLREIPSRERGKSSPALTALCLSGRNDSVREAVGHGVAEACAPGDSCCHSKSSIAPRDLFRQQCQQRWDSCSWVWSFCWRIALGTRCLSPSRFDSSEAEAGLENMRRPALLHGLRPLQRYVFGRRCRNILL